MLAGPERDALSRRLRRRLGIPDDVRVVLYAPTYRDHVRDSRRRYRLELKLDLAALRSALGDDTVVLFRKHHYIVDPVPHTPDGLVRDVSSYPDGTELMLAADVLVTDYSSMMFDFANTGRPMLFFVYDIDAYRDEIRGFYFDFADQAPGPLVRTTAELADALRDIDAVGAQFDARYRAFASRFCELDDGYASARVVDRLFSG
jgi:CDP-glycerol glycerophosphotransferase